MPKYKLRAPYWDGVVLHPVGSIIELPEDAELPPRAEPIEPPAKKKG